MSHKQYHLLSPNDPVIHSDAELLYLTTSRYEGDWHSSFHTHTFAELFYVVSGNGRFRVESDVYKITTGDLIVVNPNVEHTETSLLAHPLEYIVLGIKNLSLSVPENQENRFYLAHFQDKHAEMLSYLRAMQRELNQKQPGYHSICQNILNILMVQLTRQTNFFAALTVSTKQSSQMCTRICRYIDTHYKQQLTLDDLATVVHVNKYHLAHVFTREHGFSPMSYLYLRRIEESRVLLETTDLPVTQIARTLGFSSGSYFSQNFRKHEGLSPIEYRKMHLAEKQKS